MSSPLNVLIVDDEPDLRTLLGAALSADGHAITEAGDGNEAMHLVEGQVFDLLLTDVRMPGTDGLSLFRRVRQASPSTDVILMTGYASVPQAVAALKEGARDYLTKPFEIDELRLRIGRIAEQHLLRRELDTARNRLHADDPPLGVYGSSPSIQQLLDRIDTIAQSEAPVLIHGESGTGKELVARMLHARSPRRDGPFVAVNCASIPETLLEAELFGHERGAFTGAVRRRDGRFKAAHGGTLLLDEVAEVPLTAQAKLLRVLQEGTVERLGTDTPMHVDVRVISATHRNLRERIAAGTFREDLFYRLHVLDIDIPPLRERRAELPLLVRHFLEEFGTKGAPVPDISPSAWAAIDQYSWPGNVRELAHAIQRAMVLTRGGDIDLPHLPADIAGSASQSPPADGFRPLSVALKEYEREYLLRALELTDGKRTRAAELLGISRKNLWEKLRQHQVPHRDE